MKKESLAHNTEHLDAGTMLSVLHILHYYYPHFIDYYLHFIEKNNNLPKGSIPQLLLLLPNRPTLGLTANCHK